MSASRAVGAVLLVSVVLPAGAVAAAPSTETLIFIRHAEKSAAGLGQLSCRGLNRALALPSVLKARFGRIDAVFAPDPAHAKPDGAFSYDYVRPLATVEPAAVRFGLPVHAALGYEEGAKLRAALIVPELRDKTVLIAWEHHALNEIVPALVASLGGDAGQVPKWERPDFDSIWRVTVRWDGDRSSVAFAHEHEGLDGRSDVCPDPTIPLAAPSADVLERK